MPLTSLFTSPLVSADLTKFGPTHWNNVTALLAVSGLNVQAFGAEGDGVTDDTAAITAALTVATTTGETVILPAGTFKFTAALTVPPGVTLRGMGDATIMTPSAAVTTAAVVLAAGAGFERVDLDGVNTTGCIGISVGANGVADHVRVKDVNVHRFVGTGAIGLFLDEAVTFSAADVYLYDNEYNLVTDGGNTPTNSIFLACQFRAAVKKGVWIRTGYSLLFLSCLFESNQEEGVYLANTAATATDIRFWSCWWENNWTSLSGAPRHAQYECVVNGVGAGTIRPELRSCYFSGSAATARSLRFSTASGYLLDNVKVFNEAANILIDTASSGTFTNWPASNGAYLTTVSGLTVADIHTASRVTDVIEGVWASWTPVVTGAGSMTTTSLTIQRARWKRIGHVLHIALQVSFTVGGTLSTNVIVTLPAGQTVPVDQASYIPCFGINPAAGDIFIPMAARPITGPNPDLLQVYRTDFGNWQAGNGQVNFHGAIEVL